MNASDKAAMSDNLEALDRAADALAKLKPQLQIEVMGTLLGRMANRVEHEHITPKYFCALAWARASEIVTGVPPHAE